MQKFIFLDVDGQSLRLRGPAINWCLFFVYMCSTGEKHTGFQNNVAFNPIGGGGTMLWSQIFFAIQWPWPNFKVTETRMACKRDNFITPWLETFIFLPHIHDTNLKVKLDIQWPWPNFKVTGTKVACKCDNFIFLPQGHMCRNLYFLMLMDRAYGWGGGTMLWSQIFFAIKTEIRHSALLIL